MSRNRGYRRSEVVDIMMLWTAEIKRLLEILGLWIGGHEEMLILPSR